MTSNAKWARNRFNALKGPMANRRQRLEDSLRWHQYNFDSNTELQWIEEHMLAATSTDYGKSLVDAQNLYAKHKVRSESIVWPLLKSHFCQSLCRYNIIYCMYSFDTCRKQLLPYEELVCTQVHVSKQNSTLY